MDAGLDSNASLDADAPSSDLGALSETVSYGGNGVATNGIRNGRRRIREANVSERIREAQLQHVITNGNGAGAIAVPRPQPLQKVRPAYVREHGLTARGVKRSFDLVGALLLVAILSPLWLLIAVLIKADSPGPILFRQWRIGQDGRPFAMLKFRTMIDGAERHKPALLHLNEAGDGLFKISTDPRVTRFGRWLRATCLDELPQLLHVVTGRMSLVGPRPLVPEEDVQITGRDRQRLSMRPGMTGVWQVGGASAIPLDEMVELDRGYVDNWSPWVDVKLLAETAALVILRKGL
jgi:lipopolysaccharide/colanic/teichoic acid biosynthesis glycosyltransferase